MGTEKPAEWPMTQPVTLFQDKAHDIAKEKSELFLSKHYVVFWALFSSRWHLRARNAHMRSTPSLKEFPNVAFQTVPMLVWLTMALSRPFKEDCLKEIGVERQVFWKYCRVPAKSSDRGHLDSLL